MNKKEFCKGVAKSNKVTLKQATIIVEEILQTIENSLISGENVNIVGFGQFIVKTIPAAQWSKSTHWRKKLKLKNHKLFALNHQKF